MTRWPTLRVLAPLFVVQFFAWTGMFALWIYTTPVVAARLAPGAASDSEAYADALSWVGACYASYAFLAALINFAQPRLIAALGRTAVYAASLVLAAAGIALVGGTGGGWAGGGPALLGAFALVGLGWSAISTLPYAIAAERAGEGREDHAMRVLAFSIVIPQAVAAFAFGLVVRRLMGGDIGAMLDVGALSMLLAAVAVVALRVAR